MHKMARFILVQTTVLALCLALLGSLCSGFTQGEIIALRALEHLDKPYLLGATGPDKFDCSGLVMYCLWPEGFDFPMHSAELIGTDERYRYIAEPRQLMTGDIVCFDTVRDRDPSDHMGIYLGGNQFVHASSTGKVMVSALEDFYLEKFTGARRYAHVYCAFPAPAQLGRAIEALDIPAWLESLGIPQWIEGLRIPERIESLHIPERFESIKGKVIDLWNSIFGKS